MGFPSGAPRGSLGGRAGHRLPGFRADGSGQAPGDVPGSWHTPVNTPRKILTLD